LIGVYPVEGKYQQIIEEIIEERLLLRISYYSITEDFWRLCPREV